MPIKNKHPYGGSDRLTEHQIDLTNEEEVNTTLPDSRLAAEGLAPSWSIRMELKKVVGERGVSFRSGLDGSSFTRMTGLSLRQQNIVFS